MSHSWNAHRSVALVPVTYKEQTLKQKHSYLVALCIYCSMTLMFLLWSMEKKWEGENSITTVSTVNDVLSVWWLFISASERNRHETIIRSSFISPLYPFYFSHFFVIHSFNNKALLKRQQEMESPQPNMPSLCMFNPENSTFICTFFPVYSNSHNVVRNSNKLCHWVHPHYLLVHLMKKLGASNCNYLLFCLSI